MSELILVTGASGHVGRRVAELLAETGQRLRLMVRSDAARAPKLPNCEVVLADYADRASLDRAFSGVAAALVVSVYAEPGKRALLHKNAFEAATRAQVRHLVYTSFQGAAPDSKFPYSRDHYLTENYLRASGVPYTVLRDCLYMDVAPGFFDEHGVLRGPAGNGAVAWVAREDVALATAAAMMQPRATNAVHELTGAQALTLAETARLLSVASGRELRYQDETPEQARAWRSKLGAPDWELDTWVGTYLAIKAGELANVSDTVQQLTGRRPYGLEDYFRERPQLLGNLRTSGKN